MKSLKRIFAVIAVLLMLTGIIGYILFRRADPEIYTLDEAARKTAGGSFVQLSDGFTHYELSGPDTGRVVVLVHGFSVPYYIWDSSYSHLVQQGFRVLRYDEYGRGFSDRPDKVYKASFLRKQLSELLAALHIQSVYAMAGLSFGGPVVSDFVVNYPKLVQKVILVDPVYPGAGPADLPWSESFQRYKMATAPDDMANGQLTDLKHPDRFPDWAKQYKVQMQYKGLRRALVSTRFHYATPDRIRSVYRQLDALNKPVLLIWGRDDKTLPFSNSDSLRNVLHTEFMPVDDAGHLPHMEKTVEVNDRITAFLKADHK